MKMTVLFFSSGVRRAENRMRQISHTLGRDIEISRTTKSLVKRFQQPRGDICVMILLAPDDEILDQLALMKSQMYDLPIILILWDSKRETILKGHQFYPRFITFMDSDYSDLTHALKRLIKRENGMVERALREMIYLPSESMTEQWSG